MFSGGNKGTPAFDHKDRCRALAVGKFTRVDGDGPQGNDPWGDAHVWRPSLMLWALIVPLVIAVLGQCWKRHKPVFCVADSIDRASRLWFQRIISDYCLTITHSYTNGGETHARRHPARQERSGTARNSARRNPLYSAPEPMPPWHWQSHDQ